VAVRLDADADLISRTGRMPPLMWPTTISCWAKISADNNNYSTILSMHSFNNNLRVLQTDSDGTTLFMWGQNDGAVATYLTTGLAMAVGTWYYICLVNVSETSSIVYRAPLGSALTATSFSITAGTDTAPTTLQLGDGPNAGEWFSGCVAGFKMWNCALSAGDVIQERYFYEPQTNLQSVWQWNPFCVHGDLYDRSGMHRHFTASGTLTTEDSPPGLRWAVPPARRVLYSIDEGVGVTVKPRSLLTLGVGC
jgi:hypothetical protein